ncbi:MAG: enolase C-terminal domain-like protein, partial [Planctomycetaceae bacterium]
MVPWLRQPDTRPSTRRGFLRRTGGCLLGYSALAATAIRPPSLCAAAGGALESQDHLKIKRIKRTTVRVPFRDVPARNMARELPHWEYSEIVEVELMSGHIGFGETLLYYTWGVVKDDDVRRAVGKNAASLMWDDSLGAGLQMALFDAVGRFAHVPVHRLLGTQVHPKTPLSWWNIDTSVEDLISECQTARQQGYTAYKTKGRPWFDVWAQAEAVSQALPKSFQLDLDFNDTLLTAEQGIPILKDLAEVPQVAIYESPIPQSDIQGNQAIRNATRVPVAMHYGNPSPLVALKQDVCDGFVIGGGASRVMRQATVAALADKPFWLQLVGTGITAAFSLHLGAVLSHATWPAVNCHQLYIHSLLKKRIAVRKGFADIPESPGLGYELDRDALEVFRVEKPDARPDPLRLIASSWPDGRRLYYANTGAVNFVLNPARQGKVPFFERGVDTRLIPNGGSDGWLQLV